jgi:hypothetical protein
MPNLWIFSTSQLGTTKTTAGTLFSIDLIFEHFQQVVGENAIGWYICSICATAIACCLTRFVAQ